MKIIGKHGYRQLILEDNSIAEAFLDFNDTLGKLIPINNQLSKFISYYKYEDGEIIKRTEEEIQLEIDGIDNNINTIYSADTATYDANESIIET